MYRLYFCVILCSFFSQTSFARLITPIEAADIFRNSIVSQGKPFINVVSGTCRYQFYDTKTFVPTSEGVDITQFHNVNDTNPRNWIGYQIPWIEEDKNTYNYEDEPNGFYFVHVGTYYGMKAGVHHVTWSIRVDGKKLDVTEIDNGVTKQASCELQ